jgi:hypothetical protein
MNDGGEVNCRRPFALPPLSGTRAVSKCMKQAKSPAAIGMVEMVGVSREN